MSAVAESTRCRFGNLSDFRKQACNVGCCHLLHRWIVKARGIHQQSPSGQVQQDCRTRSVSATLGLKSHVTYGLNITKRHNSANALEACTGCTCMTDVRIPVHTCAPKMLAVRFLHAACSPACKPRWHFCTLQVQVSAAALACMLRESTHRRLFCYMRLTGGISGLCLW